jgi:hypothetical protein
MRRTICFALFGLLVSSGAVFPQARAGRARLARPRMRVIAVRWFTTGLPIFLRYDVPVPYPYPVPYAVPYPVCNFIEPLPTYAFVGSASESHPQLLFKDGITYTVTDYWRVDDQLHFVTMEEGGTKSVLHTMPFEDLDVQRTTEADAAGGFRFVLRDEPIEQWLQKHRAQHTIR